MGSTQDHVCPLRRTSRAIINQLASHPCAVFGNSYRTTSSFTLEPFELRKCMMTAPSHDPE